MCLWTEQEEEGLEIKSRLHDELKKKQKHPANCINISERNIRERGARSKAVWKSRSLRVGLLSHIVQSRGGSGHLSPAGSSEAGQSGLKYYSFFLF